MFRIVAISVVNHCRFITCAILHPEKLPRHVRCRGMSNIVDGTRFFAGSLATARRHQETFGPLFPRQD
jgi:hypothetical protein